MTAPRYGGCTCDCHVSGAVKHIAPCCSPVADEFTPTTEQVQDSYVFGVLHGESIEQRRSLFASWLAQHDAEVRADQREKDAQIAEHVHDDPAWNGLYAAASTRVAAAIRAGGAS